MHKLHLLILSAVAVIAFSGCATTLPINYIPSATIRAAGTVSVGSFLYIPSEQGEVKPNQFQKASAAIGEISISDSVPDLFRIALRKELISCGFSVEPDASLRIEGDVERFLYDWIGFVEVDFYVDVTFRILSDEKVVLIYKASSHKKAPKTMMQDTEAIKAAISQCIDDLFMEARAKKIL